MPMNTIEFEGKADIIWDRILALTSALEVFEPRLKGFQRQILLVKSGHRFETAWLKASEPYLKSEVIKELTTGLNEIAELHFNCDQMDKAKQICQSAYILSKIVLSDAHPDTIILENNLKLIDQRTRKSKQSLPRLKSFKKKQKS